MNILLMPALTLPAQDADKLDALRVAAGPGSQVTQSEKRDEVLASAATMDVLFGCIDEELFAAAPNLRWVHATASGVDQMLFPAFRDSDVVLTSEKGLVGPHLADHAMGLLLSLTRRIGAALRDGPVSWERRVFYRLEEIELEGLTMGLVGFGGTGRSLARRAAAFGMRVLAVDIEELEGSAEVARVAPLAELPVLLKESDVVAVCLPLTDQTRDLFDAAVFAQMKPGAILINVTRGEVVEREALITALESGQLGGAGLDVVHTEPLSGDDRLWQFPNVVMTPHTAGASQYRAARNMQRFVDNLGRFGRGEPLEGVINKVLGY